MAEATTIRIKRVYDEPAADDGLRVLVDRVWPRGVGKEAAKLDGWEKGLAPSTALRKWFGHDPAKFEGFRERYIEELDDNAELVERCLTDWRGKRVTLIYSAKDTDHNQAVVLAAFLNQRA